MTSAAGFGLATVAEDGAVLDAWFPDPELGAYGPSGTALLTPDDIAGELGALAGVQEGDLRLDLSRDHH